MDNKEIPFISPFKTVESPWRDKPAPIEPEPGLHQCFENSIRDAKGKQLLSEKSTTKQLPADLKMYATAASLGGSAVHYLKISDLTQEVAARPSNKVITQLQTASQEMRLALMQNTVRSAEESLARLGWEIGATTKGNVGYFVPGNRQMLVLFKSTEHEQVFGKQGLAPNGSLWRGSTGKNFLANYSADFTRFLTPAQLENARLNGALTSREARIAANLSKAGAELESLAAFESAINSTMRNTELKWTKSALPSLRSAELVRETPSEATARRNYADAVTTANQELDAAARKANYKHNVGIAATLIGGQLMNRQMDDMFFKGTPTSLRTVAVDGLSPIAALATRHWTAKLAVMAGSHLISRLAD